MTCKWKVFCKQGDTCVAHEGYDILKCTAFKEKGAITNEEWLRTATTEQLAEKLTDFSFWIVPNLPKEDKREQVRKWIENWLKEIHDEM